MDRKGFIDFNTRLALGNSGKAASKRMQTLVSRRCNGDLTEMSRRSHGDLTEVYASDTLGYRADSVQIA